MRRRQLSELDQLIAQITAGKLSEPEQVWAFRQAFKEGVSLPHEASVIGEPVTVVDFGCDGTERRGVAAYCRRPDGREYTIAVGDVVFAGGTEAARLVDAYRKWMGVAPLGPEAPAAAVRGKARRKAAGGVIPAKQSAEVVVLSAKSTTAHCRLLSSGGSVTLRGRRSWVPGEIVTVKAGEIQTSRIDAGALGLTPLRLEDCGMWNPVDQFWGEPREPIARWAKPIIARGPRPRFEMEQVIPGYDFDDPECDPIGVSNDLMEAGDPRGAYRVLMGLCEADLRCLDAHAHLGNLAFERSAEEALRHYEVGVRIGELSLAEGFDGVLAWGFIDNRPFLRCMHGYGLCLWRVGRFAEALGIFERMLWLNPSDNQGIRILIEDVRKKRRWRDE